MFIVTEYVALISDFTLCLMSTCKCHRTRVPLSTYIFDIMKLKILFLLNCESPKYIAKLFSLSIYTISTHFRNTFNNVLSTCIEKYFFKCM